MEKVIRAISLENSDGDTLIIRLDNSGCEDVIEIVVNDCVFWFDTDDTQEIIDGILEIAGKPSKGAGLARA